MNRIYLLTIILLVIALIFAFQNPNSINMKFLFWHLNGPLSLIIIVSFFIGFASGMCLLGYRLWRRNHEIKALNKKLSEQQTPPSIPVSKS